MNLQIVWPAGLASAHLQGSTDGGLSWADLGSPPGDFPPVSPGLISGLGFSPCNVLSPGTWLFRAYGVESTGGNLSSDPFPFAVSVCTNVDLSITNSGAPNPVVSGNRLTYTLTVTNNGPQDATGVTVTDPLADNVHFNSVASTKGTCVRSTTKPLPKDGTVSCSLGNLANGASATITIIVTTTTPGTLTNTATVTGNETDPNPLNNSATAMTTVIGT